MGWLNIEYKSSHRTDWHKIDRVGLMRFQYDFNGGMVQIGHLPVKYGPWGGISDIGDYHIKYGPFGGMRKVGEYQIEYGPLGKMAYVGDLQIRYGRLDRLTRVGHMHIKPDRVNQRPGQIGGDDSAIGMLQLTDWEMVAFVIAYDFWKNLYLKHIQYVD